MRNGSAAARTASLADELRNGFAFAFFAAIYALLAGAILHLPWPGDPVSLLRAFGSGYGLAVVAFVSAHGVAWLVPGGWRRSRRSDLLSLVAPFASLVTSLAALPRLLQPSNVTGLVQTAAFLGAGLAFSTARGFYAGLQQQLVPARRVRDALAGHPAAGRWLLRHVGLLLTLGPFLPWILSGLIFFTLPPDLRNVLGARWLVLTYLAHLLIRKLLEELAVWVFLHALRAGDYQAAGRLPIRPARLAVEIEAAPGDLEAPFARFIAYGLQGPEAISFPPAALARLIPVFLSIYGLSGAESTERPTPDTRHPTLSLIRRLLARGLRFRMETAPSRSLEPLPLPRWRELLKPQGQARLAALYPDEPLWHAIARLYEGPIREMLLPVSLLWLPLLGLALALVGKGLWASTLIGAALSFALLLWLTLFYGHWIFDQSLRRHDFAFLTRQLAQGKLKGELEDALGHRDRRVRDRAVELLLFDDEIARLGLTVPPAGLRKFLRRAP